MPYICISHATADQALADRFCGELSSYGFSFQRIDEKTPKDKRERLYAEGGLLLILTSPAADEAGSCATDLRRAAGSGRACICVSLAENALDKRYCASKEAIPMIPYPAGETETPDEPSVALFVHRLYIRHLTRLEDCFDPKACAKDDYGQAILNAYRARRGDAQAQYALGCAYEEGKGLPVLEEETARWIRLSANADYTDALIRMGEIRLDGKGVERDYGEAHRLFSRAARLGDARGQFAKGVCCLYGYGLMKDPEMALRYFLAAAGAGYIPALYRLGLLYRDGLGVKANHRLAVKYLYMAAVGRESTPPYVYGPKMAPRTLSNGKRRRRKYLCVSMRFMRQKRLDRILRERSHAYRSDMTPEEVRILEEKLKFCKVSCKIKRTKYPENLYLDSVDPAAVALREGDYSYQTWNPALAESALGQMLEKGNEKNGIHPAPIAALMWYRRAAKHGHLGAIFRLGDAYRRGGGVPKDSIQAVRLFHRAAELGSRRGQFAMGVCCELGEGIARNPLEAVAWYEKAAKNGYAPAQNNLGGCYEYGIGVEKDYLTAVEWYNHASTLGESNAICRLGGCYENGRGVARSPERAFRLYETAAKHGHPVALYRLALYYDRGVTVPTQVAYAAHLYERAAQLGVGDAAYAMALCCLEGRGVRKNAGDSIAWLKKSAEYGSVQGSYALGIAYYEGRVAVQNKQLAKEAWMRSASIYADMSEQARRDADKLYPMDGLSVTEAAGKALYMLGYICLEEGGDTAIAFDDFKRSAALGCGEAMTAIGDMYIYGLKNAGSDEKNAEAARISYEAAADKQQIEALLALATLYETAANEAQNKGDHETAQQKRVLAYDCLSRGEAQGSAYALVGLAGCHWFGLGTAKSVDTAYDYLKKAERFSVMGGQNSAIGNTMGALWLGDLCWSAIEKGHLSGEEKIDHARAAYRAYIRATAAPYSDAEGTPYVLKNRRDKRRSSEDKAKAEAQYRLAVLCLKYFKYKITEKEVYAHLGAAVLADHAAALDDLTRLYMFEKHKSAENRAKSQKKAESNLAEAWLPNEEAGFMWDFGKQYYGAFRLIPEPFALSAPVFRGDIQALPEPLCAPLTPTLRAEALNRLGDRYFYGQGIQEDKSAAVLCYRRAASVVQPRGEKVSEGIVWAQYSLGYCLLHGIGTPKEAREAVRFLTKAAKYHGDACLALAQCHLEGVGVDRKDRLEALKYYRRALKFGRTNARKMIDRLEAEIRDER